MSASTTTSTTTTTSTPTSTSPAQRLVRRHVCDSVDELLDGAVNRVPFEASDSKSGSRFERVTLHGEPHIVKYVHVDDDFTMRVYGDIGPRPVLVWESGLMDVAGDLIDHATVGVASGLGRHGWGAAILMRDVSSAMVPAGDEVVPIEHHLRFLDHLAGMSARAWNWRDDVGLLPYESRWQMFGCGMVESERALGFPTIVPKIAAQGWEQFATRAPADVRALIDDLREDASGLVAALRTTPSTFLHGDWKFGNMGASGDGRTVLIDWSYPGEGPVCHELCWYLALNAARLPMSKEDTIDVLRDALVAHGVDVGVDGWWPRQVALCLLGGLLQFGWEKALGGDAELEWWCARARDAAQLL
jgi:hypothetical protein